MVLDAPTPWTWFERSLDGLGAPLDLTDDPNHPADLVDAATDDSLAVLVDAFDDATGSWNEQSGWSGWGEPGPDGAGEDDQFTDDVTGAPYAGVDQRHDQIQDQFALAIDQALEELTGLQIEPSESAAAFPPPEADLSADVPADLPSDLTVAFGTPHPVDFESSDLESSDLESNRFEAGEIGEIGADEVDPLDIDS
jgi:hypothetical protein